MDEQNVPEEEQDVQDEMRVHTRVRLPSELHAQVVQLAKDSGTSIGSTLATLVALGAKVKRGEAALTSADLVLVDQMLHHERRRMREEILDELDPREVDHTLVKRKEVIAKLDAGEEVSVEEAGEVGLVADMPHPDDVTLSSGEVISKAELHEGQDDAAYYAGLTEAVGLATRARKAQEAVDALGAGKPIDPSDDPKGVALDARTGEPIKRHYHRIADQKRASAHRTWFDKGVEYGEFACACGQTVTRTVKE